MHIEMKTMRNVQNLKEENRGKHQHSWNLSSGGKENMIFTLKNVGRKMAANTLLRKGLFAILYALLLACKW